MGHTPPGLLRFLTLGDVLRHALRVYSNLFGTLRTNARASISFCGSLRSALTDPSAPPGRRAGPGMYRAQTGTVRSVTRMRYKTSRSFRRSRCYGTSPKTASASICISWASRTPRRARRIPMGRITGCRTTSYRQPPSVAQATRWSLKRLHSQVQLFDEPNLKGEHLTLVGPHQARVNDLTTVLVRGKPFSKPISSLRCQLTEGFALVLCRETNCRGASPYLCQIAPGR